MGTEYDDELKDAPRLRGMKGENPFTVPDGYFDSLSSRIQDKLNAPKQKTVWEKLVQPLQRPVFAYSIISMVMLICAGVYFIQKKEQTIHPKQMAIINITTDDLYNSDVMNDMDETTLEEALAVGANTNQASNEEEDYLIESNTDESELVNAL